MKTMMVDDGPLYAISRRAVNSCFPSDGGDRNVGLYLETEAARQDSRQVSIFSQFPAVKVNE
jgi:hypothetical protein